MEKYSVSGMSCAACQAHVEKAVSKVAGVTSCSVSLLTNSMSVEGTASEEDIIKAVTDAGYGASRLGAERKSSVMREREKALDDTELPMMKKRLAYSAAVLIVLMYFSMGHMMLGLPVPAVFENHVCLGILEMLLSLIVLFINRKFFTKGFGAVLHGGSNMDTLVALGSAASFGYSLAALFSMAYAMGEHDTAGVERLSMNGMWFESAAMIPTLITVGKTLEAYSKGRTTDALRGLMRLAPDKATLLRDGKEVVVDIGEVRVGDIFAVRAGESIPVDGIITEGSAAVNESALTGESIPVDKTVGDTVSAATVDQSGYIICRATGVGEDTMLSKIIKTVYDAAATKAPIARIADRVSAVFVPCVVGISLLTLAGWLIAGSGFAAAFTRAVSVLVISCPCALGLATPVAIMAGSGLGAKNGILYKTASALEMCGRTEIIALDKTGTITCGAPRVTDVIPLSGCTREELLRAAYSLESKSRHPLAAAVSEYCAEQGIAADDIIDLHELAGNGLTAVYGGRKLCAGSERFISQHCTLSEDERKQAEALSGEGKTPVFFSADGKVIGMTAVADAVRDESPEAIAELKALGIEVVMLTGDNAVTAAAVGRKAGVDRVFAGILPDGKERLIRELQKYGRVAMVGDGINDAPALTRADIGMAVAAGTDIAADAADVVLMKSLLTDVPAAIRTSRAVIRNIHENLFWAFFYNIICIPLAIGLYQLIFGWDFEMKPVIGAAAMSLSSVTVCLNALRLNLFAVHDGGSDRPLGRCRKKVIPTDILSEDKKEDIRMQKTITIEGMMCTHCEASVRKALEAIGGVKVSEVSHEKGVAVIETAGNVADDVLKKAVEDKDYKVVSIA